MGVAAADWDNDGFTDLAITALGGVCLFHNEAGRRFERVESPELRVEKPAKSGPKSSGLSSLKSQLSTLPGGWPTSAAFVDYDRDGWLDLFVCHYVQWTPETDVYWSLDGVNKSYTTPEKYEGESCRLYRNEQGRLFTDVTERAGVLTDRSKTMGVAVCDYDDDSLPDLIVSNDTEPTLVYHNQGDGTFREVGIELGVAVAESGKPKAGMGIDTGDDRNDGTTSILLTNFAGEQVSLYRKDSTGQYLDDAARAGVGQPSQLYLGFGAFFLDVDLDGWLDIFVTNGHVMDDIERRNTGVTYAEPALLFLNDRQGGYSEVSRTAGPALMTPQVGRGAAHGDYDNDGDLDLLLSANGGRARLLRNDSKRGNGWLKLQLEGRTEVQAERTAHGSVHTAQGSDTGPASPEPGAVIHLRPERPTRGSNRDALGARVRVRAGGRTMTRTVKSGSSYLSASDRRLTFGLGRDTRVDRIEIQWPSGAVQSLGPVERNRWLRIVEGRSGTEARAR
jgi:hypothetical protein